MLKPITALLCLLLLLSGCSSRFAYNNLDWLVYWYVDDYVELEREQKVRFDTHIDGWLSWHREQELIQYRQHLNDLRQDLHNGKLDQQQWIAHFERGREHWIRLRNRLGPELASFAVQLSDEQVDSLFEEITENDEDDKEEYYEVTADKRLENNIENMEEDLERWLGDISRLQRDIVADFAPRFRPTFESRKAYQKQMQMIARDLFRERRTNPEFSSQLLDLLQHPENYQTQQFKDDSAHNRRLSAQMSAIIQQTLSDKQKRHADKELRELIEDIDALLPEQLKVQVTPVNQALEG